MKTAQIIQDSQGQFIRLPNEVHIEGQQVYIKKIGNLIVLFPEKNLWQSFFESLDLFTDDYMEERLQPQEQKREELFA